MSASHLAYTFNTAGDLQSVEPATEEQKTLPRFQSVFRPDERQRRELAKALNRYEGKDFSQMRRRDVQRYLKLYAKAQRWGLAAAPDRPQDPTPEDVARMRQEVLQRAVR